MLTGKLAFRKETKGETLAAILRDEPPAIAESNPAVPAPLIWIVERCLAKDLEEHGRARAGVPNGLELSGERTRVRCSDLLCARFMFQPALA